MLDDSTQTTADPTDLPPTWQELKRMVQMGLITWAEAKVEWRKHHPTKDASNVR